MIGFELKDILFILIILLLLYRIYLVEERVESTRLENFNDNGEINTEALHNLSAMYSDGVLKVTDLEVTGKLTGPKSSPDAVAGDLVIDGPVRIGIDPDKSTKFSNTGTYWRSGEDYTWVGTGGFTTYREGARSSVFPKYSEFQNIKLGKFDIFNAESGNAVYFKNNSLSGKKHYIIKGSDKSAFWI
jgi:hypothetical protein